MRELDPAAAAFYAAANPNIVAADTGLNVAMVNDGAGGFRRAKNTDEVLAYGDARIGTRLNEKGEDRVGDTGRKWSPKSFETTLFVTALPRSMCVEVPGVYPVLHAKGKDKGKPVLDATGEPVMRSRWVARDRDEALRYFAETAEFLGTGVLGGGHAAMHGYDVNFDEAYPHMQLMADTLAEDPKHADELRVEVQQTWGAHREVLDPATGKVEQGRAKMTRYQQAYREHMHSLGYDVELDASERSKSSHAREEWSELQESKREDDALHLDRVTRYKAARKTQDERDQALDARESDIEAREAAVEQQKRGAVQRGYAEGIERGKAEAAKRLSEVREADEQKVDAEIVKTNAVRDAFISGLEELKALDEVETFGGVSVKRRRHDLAQVVNTQIEAAGQAPSTAPQQPTQHDGLER